MALTRAMRAQNEVETLGKVMRIRIPIGVSLIILIDKVDFAIKNENGLSYLITLGITRDIIKSSIFTHSNYSIVKDSSADLGVNFKIVQNRPTVKAVCTKISKKIFCIFVNIFIFLRENKEVSFFIF